MSLLGRYSNQYSELVSRRTVAPQRIVTDNSAVQDLASASFGNARVQCWTTPNSRQWGKIDQHHAVIMRFRMRATGPLHCRICDFEIDLEFSPALEQGLEPDYTFPQMNTPIVLDDRDDVYLIDLPAPSCIPGGGATFGWQFHSDLADDDDDDQNQRNHTARWVLEARTGLEQVNGRILHGGIALRHPGQPFQVTCHVKGKVHKPGGFKLKFSNHHHNPRLWQIVPKLCDDDLRYHIDQLEAEMVRLNTFTANQMSQIPSSGQRNDYGAGHSFGSTEVGERARVIMGTVNYNYGARTSLQ